MRLGARAALGESATLRMQQAAQELRARGVHVVDLGIGEPDFATPKPAIDGAIAALEAGFTKYTATAGIAELRDAIAARYRAAYGGAWTGESVAVTAGAKQGLYNIFMTVLDPGDEVVLPVPCWVSFPDQIRLAGAVPRLVPMTLESGFLPDPDAVEQAVGPRSRMIVLNSPSNPTGAVLTRDRLGAIVEIARAHDLLVVYDETYECFVYGAGGHVSAAHFRRELGERAVVVNSLSKTYAMTGLRIGYVVADPVLIRALAAFQGHTTSNASSVAQRAALAALGGPQDAVAEMLREYRRRRELVIAGLSGIPGVDLAPPGGAFYAFPRVRDAMARLGVTSSGELAARLLAEAHVAVVPGAPFEAEGHVRLSFGAAPDTLREGLERLRGYLAG